MKVSGCLHGRGTFVSTRNKKDMTRSFLALPNGYSPILVNDECLPIRQFSCNGEQTPEWVSHGMTIPLEYSFHSTTDQRSPIGKQKKGYKQLATHFQLSFRLCSAFCYCYFVSKLLHLSLQRFNVKY